MRTLSIEIAHSKAYNNPPVFRRYRRKPFEFLTGLIEERAHVHPVDEDRARRAARLRAEKKLGMADAIILATARAHNVTLVTGDPDFKNFDDVEYLGD